MTMDSIWTARVRARARRTLWATLVVCLVGAGLAVVPDVIVGGEVEDASTDVGEAAGDDSPQLAQLELPDAATTETDALFDPYNVLPQASETDEQAIAERRRALLPEP